MAGEAPGDDRWVEGYRAAWRHVLGQAVRELLVLGAVGPEIEAAKLLAEREDVLVVLRRVCERYGDNDWTDALRLADIVEKHLEKHLDADVGDDG